MAKIKTDKLKGFFHRLLSMKDEIETLLGRTTGDSKPVDLDLPIGRLSRADAMQMQNMAALNKRQLENKLKQAENAVAAGKDGSYGSCRNCKGEIHPERLDAKPETPFCIDCQEIYEQS